VELFVARAAHVAGLIPAAHSRRVFLDGVAEFERMLALASGYPSTWFTDAGGDALRAVADTVVADIERRLDAHVDRASVERELVARIDRIREDMEAIDTRLPHPSAGNPSRNAGATAAVSSFRHRPHR
jgi:acetylornithine deacetylase/succinyl-diaminopimelate desuccinylase-like protein